ncbi:MAG: TIGR01777 family oxidoreductase [Myxococcota bacterium]|nr:TIGR01777 family oxidoreductase [Myxococcota bacterium]
MRVVISGATGFLGRALVLRLLRDGHQLTALARSPQAAASRLGGDVRVVDVGNASAVQAAMADAEAVVNLAGESVAHRWTAKRKAALRASRIDTTKNLIDSAERAGSSLRVFVSASAIGIYGDTGDDTVDETAAPADDFLAALCGEWEAAARDAEKLSARVAIMRFGVVLGEGGGALATLLPMFRSGVGGKLGDGRQWFSWVHLLDACEAIAQALTDDRYHGAMNVTAPTPVTNAEFTRTLGEILSRPTMLTTPKIAVKLALGEAASAVLSSQRVVPARLTQLGFTFAYPELDGALREITHASPTVTVRPIGGELPAHPYVAARRPTHVLSQRTVIDAPLTEVLPFFAKAENLGAITPPDMAFTITTAVPLTMANDLVIDYRIVIGGLPLKWRTIIEEWRPGEGFTDAQHRGPYRSWFHEHRFRADGNRTIMEDQVWYALPFGPLGRLVNALQVRGMLRRIFEYRATRIALRFGGGHAKQARATATTLSPSASVS